MIECLIDFMQHNEVEAHGDHFYLLDFTNDPEIYTYERAQNRIMFFLNKRTIANKVHVTNIDLLPNDTR